jgi:MoxR-like ATPase
MENLEKYPHGVKPNFVGDGNKQFKYFADDRLRKAVNYSIALGRPLLVMGEPGVGKTRLARAIAEEMAGGKLYEWRIKSSDRVRDGLYFYDPIRRLIDTQLARDEKHVQAGELARNPFNYIRFSHLGKAIIEPEPCVLLIDEIDKADMDFPNDLLRELEELWFEITEVPLPVGTFDPKRYAAEQATMTEEQILREAQSSPDAASRFAIIHGGAKPRPIIVITSNDEKPLPMAFLRRCIVHRIEFPDLDLPDSGQKELREKNREHVLKIIRANFDERLKGVPLNEEVVDKVLKIFGEIRKHKELRKLPATAELVEWVVALHYPDLEPSLNELTGGQPLPHWEIMFKVDADRQHIAEKILRTLER